MCSTVFYIQEFFHTPKFICMLGFLHLYSYIGVWPLCMTFIWCKPSSPELCHYTGYYSVYSRLSIFWSPILRNHDSAWKDDLCNSCLPSFHQKYYNRLLVPEIWVYIFFRLLFITLLQRVSQSILLLLIKITSSHIRLFVFYPLPRHDWVKARNIPVNWVYNNHITCGLAD